MKLGGVGKTVEIGIESKFCAKRKYWQGRVSQGPWVFGAIERGSEIVLLFHVPDCTKETETLMHCFITEFICPGTVIYSGQFTPYITTLDTSIYRINESLQELCVSRQWCTYKHHRRIVCIGQEKTKVNVWYLVPTCAKLLGGVLLVQKLCGGQSIQPAVGQHCQRVSSTVTETT